MDQKHIQLPTAPSNEFLSLEDILDAIKRWKWIIAAAFAVSLTISFFWYYNQPNIFAASVKLLYSKSSGNVTLFANDFSSNQSRALGNELELLKSRQFALKVASAILDTLKLHPEYTKYPIFARLNSTKNPESIVGNLLGNRNAQSPRALDIITISFEGLNAEEAAIIANIFGSVYIDNDVSNNRLTQSVVKNFIKNQLDIKAADLKVSENQLQDYMVNSGIVTISAESNTIVGQISSVEAKINDSRLQIGILEQQIKTAEEQLKKIEPELANLSINIIDDYVGILQKQIALKESERDIKMATTNPNDYAVKLSLNELELQSKNLRAQLEKRIAEAYANSVPVNVLEKAKDFSNTKIVASVSIEIEKSKIEKLEKLLAEFETKFEEIPEKNVNYARYERARRSAEELYLILEKKYQESLISEQQVNSSIKIIDKAIPSYSPVEPQRTKMVIIFSLLGLTFGVIVAIVLKKMDNRIHKLEDLEKLNVSILGQVPIDDERKQSGNLVSDVSTIIQEMFRQIAFNINYLINPKKSVHPKLILTTSTIPQEGKTFSTIMLAATLADMGHKVLLIDGDLRRPTVDKNTAVHKTPGLTELIMNGDERGINQVKTFHNHTLDVLPSGTIPVSPAPLISSPEFATLIESFKTRYDFVILDTPPSLSVGDVYIYAEFADAVIYICGAEIVHKKDFLRQYRSIVNKFGPKVIGIILNKVRKEHLSSQGNYYYYYYSSKK